MYEHAEARIPEFDWERHEAELVLPPHARRLAAFFIDVLVVAAVVVIPDGILTIVLAAGTEASNLLNLVVAVTFFAVVLAVYATVFTLLTGGQTLGKAVLALTVRRVPDTPIQLSLKNLAWIAARFLLGYVLVDMFGVGMLAGLVTPRRKCLHDYVFGSQVVLLLEEANRPGTEPWLERLRDWSVRVKAGEQEVHERYGFLGTVIAKVAKVVGFPATAVASLAGGGMLAGRILKNGLEWLNGLNTKSPQVPAAEGLGAAMKVGVGAITTGLTLGAIILTFAPGATIDGDLSATKVPFSAPYTTASPKPIAEFSPPATSSSAPWVAPCSIFLAQDVLDAMADSRSRTTIQHDPPPLSTENIVGTFRTGSCAYHTETIWVTPDGRYVLDANLQNWRLGWVGVSITEFPDQFLFPDDQRDRVDGLGDRAVWRPASPDLYVQIGLRVYFFYGKSSTILSEVLDDPDVLANQRQIILFVARAVIARAPR